MREFFESVRLGMLTTNQTTFGSRNIESSILSNTIIIESANAYVNEELTGTHPSFLPLLDVSTTTNRPSQQQQQRRLDDRRQSSLVEVVVVPDRDRVRQRTGGGKVTRLQESQSPQLCQ